MVMGKKWRMVNWDLIKAPTNPSPIQIITNNKYLVPTWRYLGVQSLRFNTQEFKGCAAVKTDGTAYGHGDLIC